MGVEAAIWKELLNYGVLGAFAILTCVAIYKLARWWGPKMDDLWKALVGLVHDARSTINQLGENSQRQITILQSQAESSERLENGMEIHRRTLDGHTYKLDAMGERLHEHGETLEEIKARLGRSRNE